MISFQFFCIEIYAKLSIARINFETEDWENQIKMEQFSISVEWERLPYIQQNAMDSHFNQYEVIYMMSLGSKFIYDTNGVD